MHKTSVTSCFPRTRNTKGLRLELQLHIIQEPCGEPPGDRRSNGEDCEDIPQKNARYDITGLLHSEHSGYYHFIEGPREAVHQLFELLRRDPRHYDVTVLKMGEAETRQFPDFEIGFSSGHGLTIASTFTSDPTDPPADEVIEFLKCLRGRLQLKCSDTRT